MLKIREDQYERLSAGHAQQQARRLRRYIDERHLDHIDDPAKLTKALMAAADWGVFRTDEELMRLCEIYVLFFRLPNLDAHAVWRRAAMDVLGDVERPAATRLRFVEKHIIPRVTS